MMPETKVPVRVGDRDLFLRYSLGALAEGQRAAGLKTLREMLAVAGEIANASGKEGFGVFDVDLPSFNALLWAGLLESWGAERPPLDEFARSLAIKDYAGLLLPVATAMVYSLNGPPAATNEPDQAGEAAETDPPPAAADASS
jgi:hypothetical protein